MIFMLFLHRKKNCDSFVSQVFAGRISDQTMIMINIWEDWHIRWSNIYGQSDFQVAKAVIVPRHPIVFARLNSLWRGKALQRRQLIPMSMLVSVCGVVAYLPVNSDLPPGSFWFEAG